MKFEPIFVLQKIKELYQMPRAKARFEKYLYLLQGDSKDDMLLPIAGYNPMGKELATEKLEDLIQLNAEEVLAHEFVRINQELEDSDNTTIRVAINLTDDVEGSWSDRYVTDYKSKFEIDALLKRNFCTPVFWTSETVNESVIRERIREYAYRTVFVLQNKSPETLREFVEQEAFVQAQVNNIKGVKETSRMNDVEKFYKENAESNDYNLIFNFFYGDSASEELGYSSYGNRDLEGFAYARFIADHRNK